MDILRRSSAMVGRIFGVDGPHRQATIPQCQRKGDTELQLTAHGVKRRPCGSQRPTAGLRGNDDSKPLIPNHLLHDHPNPGSPDEEPSPDPMNRASTKHLSRSKSADLHEHAKTELEECSIFPNYNAIHNQLLISSTIDFFLTGDWQAVETNLFSKNHTPTVIIFINSYMEQHYVRVFLEFALGLFH